MIKAQVHGEQDAQVFAKKLRYDEMFKWPEYDFLIKQGADAGFLIQQLAQYYNKGFESVVGSEE
jgi:hypothetical protein